MLFLNCLVLCHRTLLDILKIYNLFLFHLNQILKFRIGNQQKQELGMCFLLYSYVHVLSFNQFNLFYTPIIWDTIYSVTSTIAGDDGGILHRAIYIFYLYQRWPVVLPSDYIFLM